MIVEKYNDIGMKIKYETIEYCKPEESNYYDLIKTPHGHTPAPKIKYWRDYPIPVKDIRDYNTFTCPTCGQGTFYKTYTTCNYCCNDFYEVKSVYNPTKEKIRRFFKDFECLILPLLVWLGKAWYMPSAINKYGEINRVKPIYEPVIKKMPRIKTSVTLDSFNQSEVEK